MDVVGVSARHPTACRLMVQARVLDVLGVPAAEVLVVGPDSLIVRHRHAVATQGRLNAIDSLHQGVNEAIWRLDLHAVGLGRCAAVLGLQTILTSRALDNCIAEICGRPPRKGYEYSIAGKSNIVLKAATALVVVKEEHVVRAVGRD